MKHLPILNLRNKLIDMLRHTRAGRAETIATCIKAWNAFTADKKLKKLRMGEAQNAPTVDAILNPKKNAAQEITAHVNGASVNYENMGA